MTQPSATQALHHPEQASSLDSAMTPRWRGSWRRKASLGVEEHMFGRFELMHFKGLVGDAYHLQGNAVESRRSARLHAVAPFSWDSKEWETHAVAVLCHHFGVENVVPVPDDDQGDRGLDAFTRGGIGYQCYAPEGEPLAPSKRAALQKGKITTDLKKLKDNADKLLPILGTVRLHTWVLLTPEHKSASVIEHCNTKAAEVRGWGLDFILPTFTVQIHSKQHYQRSHAFVSQTEQFGSFLTAPPEYDPVGADFGAVSSPQIETMDGKLAKLPQLQDDVRRRSHRAMLLERQLGGDVVLDRIRGRAPETRHPLRHDDEFRPGRDDLRGCLGSRAGRVLPRRPEEPRRAFPPGPLPRRRQRRVLRR
jgi:hypothetical protein